MGKSIPINSFLVTKENHHIERLSPEFRDSLRKAIDDMAQKRAQVASNPMPADPAGLKANMDKQAKVDDVLISIGRFNDHHVKDWLLGLDVEEVSHVKRLFDELVAASAKELGDNPFHVVASMMSGSNEEPEVVVEEQVEVPPVAPDGTPQQPKQVTHEEHIPLEEGMKPGMGQ